MTKEMIQQQRVLKEWFGHANRQCEIKDEYKEGFKREFENLIEYGNKLAKMPKIDRLDLLCDITDGSPQNEYLARELKEKWLIHLDDSDMKLRFFNSLLEKKIISFKELSEAYHLGHVLNWQLESNAIVAKQVLEDAGYYNNTQQDNPKAEEQQSGNKTPLREYNKELVELFHGHTELIDELIGKDDKKKAEMIMEWATKKEKINNKLKPLIDNPKDRLAKYFATLLKEEDIIRLSVERFRTLLK